MVKTEFVNSMNAARLCAIVLVLPGTVWTVLVLWFMIFASVHDSIPPVAFAITLPGFVCYAFWCLRSLNIWMGAWRHVGWSVSFIVNATWIIVIAASDGLRWNGGFTPIAATWWLLASSLSIVGLLSDIRAKRPDTAAADTIRKLRSQQEYERLLQEHRSSRN